MTSFPMFKIEPNVERELRRHPDYDSAASAYNYERHREHSRDGARPRFEIAKRRIILSELSRGDECKKLAHQTGPQDCEATLMRILETIFEIDPCGAPYFKDHPRVLAKITGFWQGPYRIAAADLIVYLPPQADLDKPVNLHGINLEISPVAPRGTAIAVAMNGEVYLLVSPFPPPKEKR